MVNFVGKNDHYPLYTLIDDVFSVFSGASLQIVIYNTAVLQKAYYVKHYIKVPWAFEGITGPQHALYTKFPFLGHKTCCLILSF